MCFDFCVKIYMFNEGEPFIEQLSNLHENVKQLPPPTPVLDTNYSLNRTLQKSPNTDIDSPWAVINAQDLEKKIDEF